MYGQLHIQVFFFFFFFVSLLVFYFKEKKEYAMFSLIIMSWLSFDRLHLDSWLVEAIYVLMGWDVCDTFCQLGVKQKYKITPKSTVEYYPPPQTQLMYWKSWIDTLKVYDSLRITIIRRVGYDSSRLTCTFSPSRDFGRCNKWVMF